MLKKNLKEATEELAEVTIGFVEVAKLQEQRIDALSEQIEKLKNDNNLASGGGHTVLWFFIVLLTIVNWVQIKLLLLSIWHWF